MLICALVVVPTPRMMTINATNALKIVLFTFIIDFLMLTNFGYIVGCKGMALVFYGCYVFREYISILSWKFFYKIVKINHTWGL
jgi:hypothetical protein